MVVNVNPYETSLEETFHVMKFASIAKEILTTRAPTSAPATRIDRRQPPVPSPVETSTDIDGDDGEIVVLGGCYECQRERYDTDNKWLF
jgi:hypothetical protein